MSFNGELLEIYSWLPAKNNLIKFSSVCKSSTELLFEDFFIEKQFKNMQLVGDTDFFIRPDYFQRYPGNKLELHAIYSDESTTFNLSREYIDFLAKSCSILASSNGLICCRNTSDEKNPLFLFNPTTQSFMQIPLPDKSLTCDKDFNIVFDCAKDEDSVEYLLLALIPTPDWNSEFHSKIYLAEEKIWKDVGNIDLGGRDILHKYSIYLDGAVYMISDYSNYLTENSFFFWPYIVVYYIEKSSSEFLSIPESARKGLEDSKLCIFKWESRNNSLKSICLVKLLENVISMWELVIVHRQSEDRTYDWTQVFEMRVNDMGLQDYDDSNVVGFTVLNGKVMLFATQEKVYRYDFTSNAKLEEVCKHGYGDGFVCFDSFSSTLRPCIPKAKKKSRILGKHVGRVEAL